MHCRERCPGASTRNLAGSCLVGLAVLLGLAGGASAQVIASDEWRQGTALAVFGGAATGSGTRAATGASVGWEFLPRLTIEGSGVWEAPRRNASAFSGLLGVRVNVTPPAQAVPFVSAGLGLYRASFDADADVDDVPPFYRRRLSGSGLGTGRDHTFDDVVFTVGGGVDLFLRRHVALRPDVRVLLVRGNSDTRAVAVYGVHLAFHFEEHPITP